MLLSENCVKLLLCAGAAEINEAAAAAERVTSDVSELVANLAKESQDGDAVEEIFEQRYSVNHERDNAKSKRPAVCTEAMSGLIEREVCLLASVHTWTRPQKPPSHVLVQ